jgi:hypothetical protein
MAQGGRMTQALSPTAGEVCMHPEFLSLETVLLQNVFAFPRFADIQARCEAIADENNQ